MVGVLSFVFDFIEFDDFMNFEHILVCHVTT